MHYTITVGVPVLAILFGIVFQHRGLQRLEAKIDRMQADLNQFYRTLGEHEGKIEMLQKKS